MLLPARSGAIEIDHQCGTNPRKFVRGNGHTDAACTDQDSSLGLAPSNAERDFAAKIWVVDGFAPFGSEVLHVQAAGTEKADQVVLEFHSTMVAANRDHHWGALSIRVALT